VSMLDDVIVNAKSAADAVGKTASKLVDISKLRISAADLNAEINRKYESLGRTVYTGRKAGDVSEEEISETIAEIDELQEQLSAVNAQLSLARKKTICSACGHENNADDIFCGKCGYRLSEEEPKDQSDE
jgi:ribosomal protein S27AE